MDLERNDYYRDLQNLRDECKRCMYYHAILTMTDGSTLDGIIEDVDTDRITVLIGEDVMEQENENENESDGQRQYYSYGRPRRRRRFRRFRRRAFPLATLAALSLLPYPILPPYNYYPYY